MRQFSAYTYGTKGFIQRVMTCQIQLDNRKNEKYPTQKCIKSINLSCQPYLTVFHKSNKKQQQLLIVLTSTRQIRHSFYYNEISFAFFCQYFCKMEQFDC